MKLTAQSKIEQIELAYYLLNVLQKNIHTAYPSSIEDVSGTYSIPSNTIFKSVAEKYIYYNTEFFGDYDTVSQGGLQLTYLANAYMYENIENLSFLKDSDLVDIPLDDILTIQRSGTSTNKSMAEDEPYSGDVSFENFRMDSPSAKAISRNDANGTDTHRDTTVDNYLKKQRFLNNYKSLFTYLDNIMRRLTQEFTTAY